MIIYMKFTGYHRTNFSLIIILKLQVCFTDKTKEVHFKYFEKFDYF